MDFRIYKIVLISWLVLAILVFIALLFISAPYGKHIRKGFGAVISNRWGWMIMEAPSSILMFVYFVLSTNRNEIAVVIFLGLWQIHYLYRSFVYPFRIRLKKDMPVLVITMAVFFNIFNSYFNGYGLFILSRGYPDTWLTDPRFITGIVLFITGFAIHIKSDKILINLRNPGETDYKIPMNGMFRWVSCPNYMGELLEWTGWAILTWSMAGLSFAVWTFANLVPRALENHRWYTNHFKNYPANRKAIIPLIL